MWIGFLTNHAIWFIQILIDPEVRPIAEDWLLIAPWFPMVILKTRLNERQLICSFNKMVVINC